MSKPNYFRMYEYLYRKGYHSKAKNHGQHFVHDICKLFQFDTILEIGCSNGLAVRKFQKQRKKAYGVDVSMIAMRYAAKEFIPNCILASASDIPFVDNFVEAIFSCDVLEHLEEQDVYKALDEIKRLTRKYLFIVLDPEPERNRDWIELAKKEQPAIFAGVENLHMTVWTLKKWRKEIENRGFNLIKRIGDLHCFEKVN